MKESFEITSVSRADLESKGFDTSQITDEQMERLASKMADDYCEQLFWEHLETIADIMELPRLPIERVIAMSFMKTIVFDGDFVNRWNPEDKDVLYAPYIDGIAETLKGPIAEYGEDLFDDDVVELLSCGEYSEMQEFIEQHPLLRPLDKALNEYYDKLSELPFNGPNMDDYGKQ